MCVRSSKTMEVPTVMNSFVIGLLLLLTSIPATETSKLRITRLPNGPELSSPAVVGTGQTLTIYCVAVTTDSPGTVQGLHWKFPNNSRVPDVRQLSEYDVGMASYLENNTWIGLLRMNRVQLSIAGIYKCVANFSGMPKNRSMEIQVSAFDCGEPDTLTNGRLRLSNSTTVTYTCNSGYRLHGASTRHCTSRRWWSWSVPQCIPIKCVLPPRPHVHGRLNGTGLTFGSTLTYSCKAGYTLNGNSTITCMANRQWSGKAPDCSPLRCVHPPLAPVRGQRNVTGLTFGSTVVYSCGTGYTLNGSSTITCMANRQWSGKAPDCNRTACGPAPDAPANGQRSGSGTTFESTVTYTCSQGYALQGDNSRTCMANGQWNGRTPTCNPVSCGPAPSAPANGRQIDSGTTFGSTVTYTCITGYTPQGDNGHTCMANGEWSGRTPICNLISCGRAPDAPANGQQNVSGTTFRSTVTYSCNRGYTLQGPSRLTCTHLKRWSGRAPTCSPVSCGPAPDAPANGQRSGSGRTFRSTVTYSCNQGYNLQGDNRRTCMANRQWSGRTPTCNPVSCGPAPKTPANGQQNTSGTTFRSTVTYTCNPGYTLQGDNRHTCMANGHWSGRAPTCDPIICGPAPDAPANGQRSGSGRTFRSTVTYTCNRGYTLVGSSSVTCMANRQWSGRAPICNSDSCGPAPDAPVNGQRSVFGTMFGSTWIYTCNRGYTLQGDSIRSCMANGQWSGMAPTCNPVNCGPAPDAPANGQRSGSGTTFGSTVTYTCNPGYILQGDSRRTCMANGQWSGVTTRCSRTPMPNVTLARSSLDSLLIRWSVSSTEHLNFTNYTVYWSGPSAEAYKTNSTGYNNYTIKGLHSNSPYNVTVEAIDPLGRQNSTNQLYFTSPAAPSMKITILPEFALHVMWTPAPDASRSSLTYVINVTGVSGDTKKLSASVTHPISMKHFTGFSSYSVDSVLLQATNRGAKSTVVTVSFRMVNLTGEVSNITAEWINNTTLRVKWEPVQVTVGVSTTYTVNASPIIGIVEELQSLSQANVTEIQMCITTMRTFVIMGNLHPSLFYHVTVMVHLNQFQDPSIAINGPSSAVAGNCASVVSLGTFLGGLVAGIVLILLVEGIVFGVMKLRRHGKVTKSAKEMKESENTYETVEPKESAALSDHVAMETNPAYASVH